MSFRRLSALVLVVLFGLVTPWSSPAQPRGGQATDVWMNVTGGGTKKLNIAIPEFTVVSGTDAAGTGKLLASVAGSDLTFSGLFSVVAGTGAIPANNPAALEQAWQEFSATGAHAALHGLLAVRSDRLEAEMRLYDLVTPEHRLIATKKQFVFGIYRRRLKTIGYLGQIDKFLGVPATTRNWNTIGTIVRILKDPA